MSTIKLLHVASAYVSIIGFIARGGLMIAESPYLKQKWIKIVPHIIDTILLTTAILLAIRTSQYPLTDGWLTAKVVALLVYIVLGTIALKRGKTKQTRVFAFIAALLVFAYMVLVALNRSPWIFS